MKLVTNVSFILINGVERLVDFRDELLHLVDVVDELFFRVAFAQMLRELLCFSRRRVNRML